VLQGLTLPPLIRVLGVAGSPAGRPAEEKEARRTILQAALNHLEKSKVEANSESTEVYDDLAQHYRGRLAALTEEADGSQDEVGGRFYRRFIDLSQELMGVERTIAVQLRNQRRISDEFLREIEHELDLGEARLIAKSK
jgi:CPA1 family monovalent cation:H+ antiporter